jgi:hypothetical protein
VGDVIDAYQHYKEVFGKELAELGASVVATAIRSDVTESEGQIEEIVTTLRRNSLPGATLLESASGQMKSIRTGDDEQALSRFKTAYREIGEAIKRAAELEQALTLVALEDLHRARRALIELWPVLSKEPDVDDGLRDQAKALLALLSDQTFYRELPRIDEHAVAVQREYERRHEEAVEQRTEAYERALKRLRATRGWELLDPDRCSAIEGPLVERASGLGADELSIPMLREQTNASEGLLKKAAEDALRLVDGGRVVTVDVGAFFSGGIETEEQLQAALDGLKEHVLELIAEGKRALIQ